MKNKKSIIALICVIAAAIVSAAGFLIIKNVVQKKNTSVVYDFSTSSFEDISSVKSLNGELAVYTDSKTGLKGIMDFTGKVTDTAQFKEFYIINSEWRSYRFAALPTDSEYKRLVDTSTGVVTNRQYHDSLTPEKLPCWSESAGFLVWKDATGTGAQIRPNELALAEGRYPVCTTDDSGAKYGYIDSSLQLENGLIYENALDYSEGLAAAKKNGKWGYINEKGETVISFEYDSVTVADMNSDFAFAFKQGLAPVCKDSLYGIIANNGEKIVDFVFDVILPGKDGKFIACKGGKWGLITLSETTLNSVEVPETTTVPNLSGTYIVRTSGSPLNMRDSASANGNVVAKIPNESTVEVIENVNGWARVSYGSVTGWVNITYIVPAGGASSQAPVPSANGEPGKYKVTTSGGPLNLRVSPDATSNAIEKIPNGTVVNVSEFSGNWAKVSYNSATGWVSADYIVPAT